MTGRFATVLTLLMLSWNSAPGADAAELPSIIRSAHSPWPEWVAADLAVADDGTLRAEMLGQFIPSLHALAHANEAARAKDPNASDNPCRVFRGSTADHLSSTTSIEGLTTQSAAIVSGEVIAMSEGFFGGHPGTLLLLSARYLKGSTAAVPLLFYPYAQIETREGTLCARPFSEFVAPQVGDRLLIFAMGEPRIEHGRTIFSVNVSRQLVHASRGKLRVPEALRAPSSGLTFEGIERASSLAIDRPSKTR